ncbi:hypothetical protein PRIPAC_71871 [Pristionchus pacificus]|uniref:Uncharacterized protein n=1 Tax=Pristionchus pacificus TaxID=54126 RepID=A0A2A6BZH7_PRIPA|nr:hypothetical protein PRIPAC_71871 [Pristionchus pacificus]|eukprot:PDM71354.1 hypothetical protein PRIPAC_37761 [Pristionchus pacificus]
MMPLIQLLELMEPLAAYFPSNFDTNRASNIGVKACATGLVAWEVYQFGREVKKDYNAGGPLLHTAHATVKSVVGYSSYIAAAKLFITLETKVPEVDWLLLGFWEVCNRFIETFLAGGAGELVGKWAAQKVMPIVEEVEDWEHDEDDEDEEEEE